MLRKLAEIINFVHSRMCRGTRYVHRVERTCTVAEWGVSNKQRRTGEERDFLQSTRTQQQLIFSLSDTISQHADAADKRPGRCSWSLITSSWRYSSAVSKKVGRKKEIFCTKSKSSFLCRKKIPTNWTIPAWKQWNLYCWLLRSGNFT